MQDKQGTCSAKRRVFPLFAQPGHGHGYALPVPGFEGSVNTSSSDQSGGDSRR